MKKQLISTSGSLLRFHGPPVTPTKQAKHEQQQRDASTSASASAAATEQQQQLQKHHIPPPPIPLSPRLKLHIRSGSNLVHMLVSPTLSTRSSISSVCSNYSSSASGSPGSATSSSSSSTYTSPTVSQYSPKILSPPTPTSSSSSPSSRFSHSRTLSLPSSPMLSRRSWTNRLSLPFQSLSPSSSRRSYNPGNSPLFDVLDVPGGNDYAAFESWEGSLRLYLGSQELEGVIDADAKNSFTDTQRLKAKKVIQTHVCDKFKMDIQVFDTPAEIFAFLRKVCLPMEGQALGETMVKLATDQLSLYAPSNKIAAAAANYATGIHQQQQQKLAPSDATDEVEVVKRFNRTFKGRLWALGQAGSPLPEHAAASMYLGAVEKAFEAWRMGMLWMDLSLGILKLDGLMKMFENGKNVAAWKKRGTSAGLLCWAENMGKGQDCWSASPSASSTGGNGLLLETIPESNKGLGLRC